MIPRTQSDKNKDKTFEPKKTTVSIPPLVLDKLQLYIAKNPKANLRDQSNIMIYSLIKFLNAHLEEKYRAKPSAFLDPIKTLERLNLPDEL